jgi:MerR family transcriptional regulator, light-induced transcriptional regulator
MNIQAVAKRTGVPAATLRKWEQRYGVLAPERTPGSHRRYSERDVARVEWLKSRLAEGYRIGEAARLIQGDAEALPAEPDRLMDELVDATVSRSFDRMQHVIDQAFALFPLERAITEVVEPALDLVGDLWEQGDARVVDEHFLTELARGKVRSLLAGALDGPRGCAVLLCVPGERHEIGLLALAVLLHADGWGVVYLGADTPLAEAAELAESRNASFLFVSATMREHADAAGHALAEIALRHPSLEVVRGGAAFGGESARAAVERVRHMPAGVG